MRNYSQHRKLLKGQHMMCVFFHLQQLTAQIFVTFINAINITITFEIAVNALATTNAFELMQI